KESIMLRNFHSQPHQQATQTQRLWTQSQRPAPRLRHHFRMQPYPGITQDQGHRDKQQPQSRMATAGANAGLMQLAIRRLNPETPAIGGAYPTQGAMTHAPSCVQQRLALVPPPPALGVVID